MSNIAKTLIIICLIAAQPAISRAAADAAQSSLAPACTIPQQRSFARAMRSAGIQQQLLPTKEKPGRKADVVTANYWRANFETASIRAYSEQDLQRALSAALAFMYDERIPSAREAEAFRRRLRRVLADYFEHKKDFSKKEVRSRLRDVEHMLALNDVGQAPIGHASIDALCGALMGLKTFVNGRGKIIMARKGMVVLPQEGNPVFIAEYRREGKQYLAVINCATEQVVSADIEVRDNPGYFVEGVVMTVYQPLGKKEFLLMPHRVDQGAVAGNVIVRNEFSSSTLVETLAMADKHMYGTVNRNRVDRLHKAVAEHIPDIDKGMLLTSTYGNPLLITDSNVRGTREMIVFNCALQEIVSREALPVGAEYAVTVDFMRAFLKISGQRDRGFIIRSTGLIPYAWEKEGYRVGGRFSREADMLHLFLRSQGYRHINNIPLEEYTKGRLPLGFSPGASIGNKRNGPAMPHELFSSI